MTHQRDQLWRDVARALAGFGPLRSLRLHCRAHNNTNKRWGLGLPETSSDMIDRSHSKLLLADDKPLNGGV